MEAPDRQSSKHTPLEQALMWERMSGTRLPAVERQRILAGGEFRPPVERRDWRYWFRVARAVAEEISLWVKGLKR